MACAFSPKRIVGRIVRELRGRQGQDYLSRTNQALIRQGVISTPLSIQELYAITDVHVWDGEGVSINRMRQWMDGYDCIAHRSYAFFGKLASTLQRPYDEIEKDLIGRHALNGYHVAAAWRLRSQTAVSLENPSNHTGQANSPTQGPACIKGARREEQLWSG